MPSWQMPDAIHVRGQPLPTNGDKIANKTLRTTEFRQRALAEELVHAGKKLQEELREGPASQLACTSEDEALVNQIFGEGDSSATDSLKVLFGDSLPLALQTLRSDSADAAEQAQRGALLELLRVMAAEERAAFVLGASSLLGNWAANKLA